MKKQSILSGLIILTFALILSSCKKNEANETKKAIPAVETPVVATDTTAKTIEPAVTKETLKKKIITKKKNNS